MESVTMVVPLCSLSSIAAIMAMSLLRFSSLPPLSTAPALSTSVSNIMPRSALVRFTASIICAIARASSGFGAWLGKRPSGSVKRLPSVSAPSFLSTSFSKKPPAPLPASIIMRMPSSGFSSPVPLRIASTNCLAYTGIKSTFSAAEQISAISSSGIVSAIFKSSAISSFSKPPFALKNLKPFLSYGRWLAVVITEASNKKPSVTVAMNIAGVVARPASKLLAPSAAMPASIALQSDGPLSLESRPASILSSLLPSLFLSSRTSARPIA